MLLQGLFSQMLYGGMRRKERKMSDPLDLELELECKYCNFEETITVAEADYIAWNNGQFIQDSFPYLTAGQRELMISNTCDTCWNRFFPYADDEDNYED